MNIEVSVSLPIHMFIDKRLRSIPIPQGCVPGDVVSFEFRNAGKHDEVMVSGSFVLEDPILDEYLTIENES